MNYLRKKALFDLSVTDNTLTDDQKNKLLNDGYCTVYISPKEWKEKRGIDLDLVSKVIDELIDKEGWRGGWDHISHKMKEGKHPEEGAQRLNNLLNKHECFRKIFTIPEALAASDFLIKNDFCLSQLILRMPLPGKGEQPWHIDWIPRRSEKDPIRSVLTSLLLDDFNIENGTTRVVPGSHKWFKTPAEGGYFYQDHPDQKYIIAPKGTMLIYDINLWHCGTKNVNGKKRRHLNINYRDRKIWQQIKFKKELSQTVKKDLIDSEKYLLKIRDEDPSRNEWMFKNRNNFFVKKLMNLYWNFAN